MSIDKVPNRRKKNFDDHLSVPISSELKAELYILKTEHGKEPVDWVRQIIRKELDALNLKHQDRKTS